VPFQPPCCPLPKCPSQLPNVPFEYARAGTYVRRVDGRIVPRFRCRVCGKRFSEQTFRGDYRHKKPHLNEALYHLLVGKVTLRQSARSLGCNRKAVDRRIPLLGKIARAVHERLAPDRNDAAFLQGGFVLDELETYAESRRNNPLTAPAVVHKRSFFVVHTEVGLLPRRGGKGRDEAPPKPLSAEEEAARNAGSKVAVAACCTALAELAPESGTVVVATDMKPTYPGLLREAFGARLVHDLTHSEEVRNRWNPLFAVNHTFAMLRDGVSRLVRETWAASKRAARLRDHLWVWVSYRNYIRGMTNKRWSVTPAMIIGACKRKLGIAELLLWRSEFVAELIAA
jgi:transposase-like protein